MKNSTDKEKTILIVDDDPTLLYTLKNGLSLKGYHCNIAPNANSAIELIKKTSFDIVIIDIVIPDMDGLKLAENIKSLRPSCVIIIMTGYIEDFSYNNAIEVGASDFIKKPFTLKELIARIEHAKRHKEMHTLLLTDELTGLYNRRGFFALGDYQLRIAKRQLNGIYMLYADLDDLKTINDKWGHHEGDLTLMEIAEILKQNYRESDVIARIGGDEFVVLPVGMAGDNIETIIDRLHKAIDFNNTQSSRRYKLSISAGIAYFDPTDPCSIEDLLDKGDKSMYERKKMKHKDSGFHKSV